MVERETSIRLPTGVPGLDEVLRGGLISARAYLVRGGPGTGKSILGLHFLTAVHRGRSGVSRVLILLDHHENGRLVAELLGARHEVVRPEPPRMPDKPFDLCIVDAPALTRLADAIHARREAEAPIFLPTLLVAGRGDKRKISRHLWRAVDEVLFSPVEMLELTARSGVLLRIRGLTLELKQSEEALRAVVTNAPGGARRGDRSPQRTPGRQHLLVHSAGRPRHRPATKGVPGKPALAARLTCPGGSLRCPRPPAIL